MKDDLFEDVPEEVFLAPLENEKEEEKLKEWAEKLHSLKMDVNNPIPSPQPLLFFDECCILRRQRIVIITGASGSRKTSFLTLLCSAMGGGQTSPRLEVNGVLKGVYIDTEQNPDQTFRIKERIEKMGANGRTEVFNTLDVPNEIMPQLIEKVTKGSNADYLILDNATDIFKGVMDEEQASFAGWFIRQLAKKYNLCVICVIHQNEGRNQTSARGWIGRELTRKSDFIFLVEKKEDADFSVIKFPKVRDSKAPKPVKISHDEKTGFPMLEASPTPTRQNPDNYAEIVNEIPPQGILYNELVNLIKNKGKAEATAKKWIPKMEKAGAIIKRDGRYYNDKEENQTSIFTDEEPPFLEVSF